MWSWLRKTKFVEREREWDIERWKIVKTSLIWNVFREKFLISKFKMKFPNSVYFVNKVYNVNDDQHENENWLNSKMIWNDLEYFWIVVYGSWNAIYCKGTLAKDRLIDHNYVTIHIIQHLVSLSLSIGTIYASAVLYNEVIVPFTAS